VARAPSPAAFCSFVQGFGAPRFWVAQRFSAAIISRKMTRL